MEQYDAINASVRDEYDQQYGLLWAHIGDGQTSYMLRLPFQYLREAVNCQGWAALPLPEVQQGSTYGIDREVNVVDRSGDTQMGQPQKCMPS